MSDYKTPLQPPSGLGASATGFGGRASPFSLKQSIMGASPSPVFHWLHDVAAVTFHKARRTLFQAGILFCALVLLLWVSIFLYGSFYYSYMPTVSFSTPVNFYYTADCDSSESALCSFPTANISFMKNEKEQVMANGQPYRISVELEMPESPVNEHLGMFMVKMTCYTKGGKVVSSVGRSTMLHYRSSLLKTMSTLLFSPLLVSGVAEQKQLIEVELVSDYKTNSYQPTVGAVIEVQSRRVQIYSSQLRVHAYFTGVRYVLYNFPLTSAVIGVATNFAFLSIIVLLSYLQFLWGGIWPPEQVKVRVMMGDNSRMQQRKHEVKKRMERESSMKELNSPKVVGPMYEEAGSNQNDTEEEKTLSLSEDALGFEVPETAVEESHDLQGTEEESETMLRQRPGAWMSQ
ncbi:seipin-like [Eucyclogobius newberryi]|uniref:seipin-like n=1 Tax=Eucyclogobius newberryi TaxID=166745 RepID=UPI003B58C6DA